jgi:TetR/AcrR family transcriptional repressor of nem operon
MARLDGPVPTEDRILDVAERLVQTRGYNGFSYADVSRSLRIEKASIHYHFPSKAGLGVRLVARYHERFRGALLGIEAAGRDPRERLRRYVRLWAGVLRDGEKMCLCGMLAAEVGTLPRAVRDELRDFFDANEAWLAAVLAAGRRARSLRFPGSPGPEARALLMGLEGAMLVARAYGEPARFEEIVGRLLARVGARL